jgi:hypothetical protein
VTGKTGEFAGVFGGGGSPCRSVSPEKCKEQGIYRESRMLSGGQNPGDWRLIPVPWAFLQVFADLRTGNLNTKSRERANLFQRNLACRTTPFDEGQTDLQYPGDYRRHNSFG